MPRLFAACYNSTGDATVVAFSAKRAEVEDHPALDLRLEEAGYTGPFVYFDTDHFFIVDECETVD